MTLQTFDKAHHIPAMAQMTGNSTVSHFTFLWENIWTEQLAQGPAAVADDDTNDHLLE